MFFNKNLNTLLLGVYRNSGTFNIFPQQGLSDWGVIYNHEFTHIVLAVSTTSGFIHQMLAYLGYSSSSPLKNHWRSLYQHSVDISRNAHESAATFVSLCDNVHNEGRQTTFQNFKIHSFYQDCYNRFDSIIPKNLNPGIRSIIARTIAIYAFNDPLSNMLGATWEDLTDEAVSFSLMPKVDDRFNRLLQIIKGQGKDFFGKVFPDSLRKELIFDKSKMKFRDFLAYRREIANKRYDAIYKKLADLFSHQVESTMSGNKSLSKLSSKIRNKLNQMFLEHNDKGLEPFSREYKDESGVDPFLYDGVVLRPNQPLTGLVRLPSFEILLQNLPALISITKADLDCQLSSDLILKKGQYYIRYFFFQNGKLHPITFYSINDEFPKDVWKLTGATVLVHLICDESGNRDHLNMVRRPDDSKAIVIYLDRITRGFFDYILSKAHDWQFAAFGVPGVPGIYNFWLYNKKSNSLWIADIPLTILGIFAEEGQEFSIQKLSKDDLIVKENIHRIGLTYPYIGISEGVPIQK